MSHLCFYQLATNFDKEGYVTKFGTHAEDDYD